MWASTLLFFLLICQIQTESLCPCNGVLIPGSDQEHCWEVVSGGSNGGWVSGDVACQTIGGHLGHLNTKLNVLIPYLQKVYARPILTGIVAGNADTQRYSMVCPNNIYYGQWNSTMTSSLLVQNATNSSSCAFVTNADYKVHFAPCSTAADALCDRPLEKADYCSIKINCTSTTTSTTSTTGSSSSTSTTTTTTTSLTTSSTTTSTSLPTSPIVSLTSNATSPTTTSSVAPTTGSTSSTRITSGVTTVSTPTTMKVLSSVSSLITPTVKSSCPTEDCDWKIFGTCAPWFPWLCLALLLLGLLGWICWYCAFCGKKKEQNQIAQTEAGVLSPRVQSAPLMITRRTAVSYSPEPAMHNPPVVVESPPIVMAPFKMSPGPVRKEVIEKFTKEIHVVEKEKVILKDVGVNTDPWTPTLEVALKSRRPVPTPIEIQDDPADDVSLDMPLTPGLDDGDFVFSRNTRPDGFGDVPIGDMPSKQTDPRDPATVINLTADPRNIRSPPSKQRNVHLPTDDVRSFSPISDVSENALPLNKPGPRFQSPPKRKPKIPETIPSRNSSHDIPEKKPSFFGSEFGNNTDTPPASEPNGNRKLAPPNNSRRPSRNSNGTDGRNPSPNNNRSRSAYSGGNGPLRISTSPAPVPLMKTADVSIRAAHGKLGGVVRGGGGPDDQAPQGWKPWAKTSKGFQPGH